MRYSGFLAPVALLAAACARAPISTSPLPEAGDRVRYSFLTDSTVRYVGRTLRMTAETLFVERMRPSMTGGPARYEPAALATASLARLEKRVGRRGNVGKGALIGTGIGLVAGIFCAAEDPGWLQPSPVECVFGYSASGAAWGAALGALIRSDVWRPIVLPLEPRPAPGDLASSHAALGIGIRVQAPGVTGRER